MTLVVDAGAVLVSADVRDHRRTAVQDAILAERGSVVIPAPVCAEIDYMLGRRLGRAARLHFIDDLAAARFRVAELTLADLSRIALLERQYADLDPGLADLSIVVAAARLGTTRLLTFDERHFRAIAPLDGDAFTLLPADA